MKGPLPPKRLFWSLFPFISAANNLINQDPPLVLMGIIKVPIKLSSCYIRLRE